MEAKVFKLSESGKTMLVGAKTSKYSVGYTFGWCANPGNVAGDVLNDFNPVGTTDIFDENGVQITAKNGEPIKQWVF